jgi:aldehyde dehydrogenase (NAD+)
MVNAHFDRLKASFNSGRTRPLSYRKQQLKNVLRFLAECEEPINKALDEDLRKPRFESLTSEIGMSRAETRHALAHLDEWARIRRVPTPITQIPSTCSYTFEPKGLILILGPWNFPLQLIISPLIGAIAAGNTMIIKPSEHAPHTSRMLAELLPRYVDTECLQVIEGDQEISHALLEHKFDHIFFTGSTRVGRLVMEAAAKHLTPVTLELGGKCPTFVDESADIALSAKRILWGKLINAGQVCLAPDYVLVHQSKTQSLIAALKKSLESFYGKDVRASSDYARIINCGHVTRLQALLKDQNIVYGGDLNVDAKYFSPTLVLNPALDSPLMQEEIFGPILPIIEYSTLDEAIGTVNKMERPLALYVFSKSTSNIDKILSRTASGGVCINDTVSHVAVPSLPFGGVGASGMGNYHGEDGFQAFSYKRACLKKSTLFDLPLRYAPYHNWKARVAGWFLN